MFDFIKTERLLSLTFVQKIEYIKKNILLINKLLFAIEADVNYRIEITCNSPSVASILMMSIKQSKRELHQH